MTVFKSVIPSPHQDDETVIGFFSSEEVAKKVSEMECPVDAFIVEPVNVAESVEAFYANKKEETAKRVLSNFSSEVREALVEYIIKTSSKS